MKNKIIQSIRPLAQSWWGYPFLLFVVGFGAYLYSVMDLGYYWDDWEVVYLTSKATWQDLMGYFWFDRPLAWPYLVYSELLGVHPLGWHLIHFLLRFGAILCFYRSLLYLWPARKYELGWVGLLLIVFPGFLQHSISTAYSRHFTSLFLFAMSLYLTARAVRATSQNWFYWIGAFLTGALQIFTIEYYAALELIRPVFLWFLIEGDRWKKLRTVAMAWAPFFLIFVGFFSWRVFYYPTTIVDNQWGQSIELFDRPASASIPNLIQKIFLDSFHLIFRAWFDMIYDPTILDFRALITFVAFFLAIILGLYSVFVLSKSEDTKDHFAYQALIIGVAGVLLGGLPIWIIGRSVTGGGLWDDRFSQAPMFGAVLLTVLIISIVVRARWRTVILAAMLICAIATQVITVNKYRLDWQYQKNLYWQMYWRAPTLAPDTAIYSKYIPSVWLPEYDASFAFSLLYGDHPTNTDLPYWFFPSEKIVGMKLKPGKPINISFRNLRFTGNASNGVSIFYHPTRGCLRILDPIYQADPIFVQYQSDLFPLSNPQRIQLNSSSSPNPAIFGQEPSSDWCYYFEKADLARQFADWDAAIDLYKQAKSLGLSPIAGGEYIPFIEAYIRKNEFKQAFQLTIQARRQTKDLEPLLCENWKRLDGDISIPESVSGQVQSRLGCSW